MLAGGAVGGGGDGGGGGGGVTHGFLSGLAPPLPAPSHLLHMGYLASLPLLRGVELLGGKGCSSVSLTLPCTWSPAAWWLSCRWGMEEEEEESARVFSSYPAVRRVSIAVDETNVLPGALQLIRTLRPQWETERVKTKVQRQKERERERVHSQPAAKTRCWGETARHLLVRMALKKEQQRGAFGGGNRMQEVQFTSGFFLFFLRNMQQVKVGFGSASLSLLRWTRHHLSSFSFSCTSSTGTQWFNSPFGFSDHLFYKGDPKLDLPPFLAHSCGFESSTIVGMHSEVLQAQIMIRIPFWMFSGRNTHFVLYDL